MKRPQSKLGLVFSFTYLGILAFLILFFVLTQYSDVGGVLLLSSMIPWSGLWMWVITYSDRMGDIPALFPVVMLGAVAINAFLLYAIGWAIDKALEKLKGNVAHDSTIQPTSP